MSPFHFYHTKFEWKKTKTKRKKKEPNSPKWVPRNSFILGRLLCILIGPPSPPLPVPDTLAFVTTHFLQCAPFLILHHFLTNTHLFIHSFHSLLSYYYYSLPSPLFVSVAPLIKTKDLT
ncbi:hypothetical protein RIF29_22003 [Crotalaria pallida]|uniref:Uncharacterized protein n=1 Tax=Crotalaria pallida TaxID=3830 RepID=A0AAN9F7Y9_CROPI